jgi:menaquinone-specific isochorismate synthase
MSFYVQDFFLSDPQPWRIAASGAEIGTASRRLPAASAASLEAIDWEPMWSGPFAENFRELQDLICAGRLRKGVPVAFEEGRVRDAAGLWGRVRELIPSLPSPLSPYFWRKGGSGFFGATPELLFRAKREGGAWTVRTMALAGTAPRGQGERLLEDPKETHEHQLVVDDVVRELRGLGKPERGATVVHRLPTLEHLRTDIELRTDWKASPGELFRELVRCLHPTAALGAAPRNADSAAWMRRVDASVGRGVFGAPFGAVSPEGEMACLVAIRQVQLAADGRLRVGSGCGVVEQSRWEREWRELSMKRASVKALFGLGGELR